MKRIIRVALLVCVLAVGIAVNLAETMEVQAAEEDFKYKNNEEGGITITGYQGDAVEVTVPAVIAGKTVTGIGANAFKNCKDLTGISLPEDVTTIEASAFSGYSSLTEVKLPKELKTLWARAFQDCSSLKKIEIPAGVTRMGDDFAVGLPVVVDRPGNSFSGCSNLTDITVAEGNTVYESENGILYSKGKTSCLRCPEGKSGEIKIPAGVTGIEIGAFSGCQNLTEISVPQGVTSIREDTFSGCSSLEKIELPTRVTSIGNFAFSGCSSLKEIVLPTEITSIGSYAFSGCNSLLEINLPKNVTDIGASAFGSCISLTEIFVEEGNSSYQSRNGILYDAAGTELICCPRGKEGELQIPEGTAIINDSAFSGCSSLKRIVLPIEVTSIGNSAFSGCSSLEEIALPTGVTSISNAAFTDCSSMKKIELPTGITGIREYAFYGCSSLEHVYYAGSQEQWEQIEIADGNVYLRSAAVHYNFVTGGDTAILESITVMPPVKKEYTAGESFAPAGMKVTANYSDKSTKDVTAEAKVSGFDSSKEGSVTITVSYEGRTAVFTVTIKKADSGNNSSGSGTDTDGSGPGTGGNTNGNTTDNPKEDTKAVKVTKLSLSAVSKKIAAGKKTTLKVTVKPENASNQAVTWSTSNKKYASVNSKGVVTTKKAGAGKTVTITAKAADGSGVKASVKLKLMKHAVTKVQIKNAKKTLKAEKTMKLKAAVKTTGSNANKTIRWTTSNKKYATVNSKGVVKALKAGTGKTVTITAAAADGSNKKAKVKIKIK